MSGGGGDDADIIARYEGVMGPPITQAKGCLLCNTSRVNKQRLDLPATSNLSPTGRK